MLSSADIKLVQQESPIAEKQGELTQKQLQLIYDRNWFHLLVPKNLGGKEMSLPDFALFMEELASINGSFAWAINLGAGANMFAGYIKQETAKNIFASEKTCIAGSGAVGGTAIKKEKGYSIKGHWKYASGASHATFFSLNAQIVGENNKVKSFLVPAGKVELLNTWHVFGLKATNSCEFELENVWVPENYCFDLQQVSPWGNSALYRFPFNTLAEINMLTMATGLGFRFKKLGIEISKQKNAFGKETGQKIYESTIFQTQLKETEDELNIKRKQTFELLDELWNKTLAEKNIENEEKERFTKSVIQTASAVRNMVDRLYPFFGMIVIFENQEINRVYRDFKVASQHALLSPIRH